MVYAGVLKTLLNVGSSPTLPIKIHSSPVALLFGQQRT